MLRRTPPLPTFPTQFTEERTTPLSWEGSCQLPPPLGPLKERRTRLAPLARVHACWIGLAEGQGAAGPAVHHCLLEHTPDAQPLLSPIGPRGSAAGCSSDPTYKSAVFNPSEEPKAPLSLRPCSYSTFNGRFCFGRIGAGGSNRSPHRIPEGKGRGGTGRKDHHEVLSAESIQWGPADESMFAARPEALFQLEPAPPPSTARSPFHTHI